MSARIAACRAALAALCLGAASPALASTLEQTVAQNKAEILDFYFGIELTGCAAYAAHEVHIDTPPRHGVAAILDTTLALPKSFGVCAGKRVKMKVLGYKPAKGYRGPDSVAVSYTLPSNTGESSQKYISRQVDITVK